MKYSRIPVYLKLFTVFVIITAGIATNPSYGANSELPVIIDKQPVLSGTFIQILEQNADLSRPGLEKLFDAFQALGLRRVVVQWTLFDNKAFFVTTTFKQAKQPPLETMLELAEARGIDLYLGLAAESGYWEMIKQPPAGLKEYLNQLRWKSERVAQEIAVVAAGYGSFKGWYIPEEIDDVTWRSPESRALLYQHLKQLTGFIKKLTPSRPVMLSGFTSARMAPDAYREFWQTLLETTSVDILIFQDGFGTGTVPGELMPLYLKAVRQAADANHKKLQIVVELFTVLSESPFQAIPAPFTRMKQQLLLADDYATDGINSFSVPDYMLRTGDAAAAELLRDYQKYRKGGHLTTP